MGININYTFPAGRRIPSAVVDLPQGFTAPFVVCENDTVVGAYASICKNSGVHGGMNLLLASITIWDSQNKGQKLGEEQVEFVPDTNGPNWVAQAWLAAKEQFPKYAEGVDVFEEGQSEE
jgi:hypothetical protein